MTDKPLVEIWVYLSTRPLFGLTATLATYLLAYRIYRAGQDSPLLNPVALAVAMLILLLQLTGIDYLDYFEGAQFVHFMLGPATVWLWRCPFTSSWANCAGSGCRRYCR